MFEILLVVGMVFGFVILYKMMRSVPKQPDFVKIFKDQAIRDEDLNMPHDLDPKFLYRGEKLLGRIVRIDSQDVKYEPPKIEKETAQIYDKWEKNLTTVIFRGKTFWNFYLGEKKILIFETGEAKIDGRNLIFPSSVGFTAVGQQYTTKTSFRTVSQIIEGEWSKRLFEANVNVMASRMAHISAETPEMAHELSLRRLDIERIKAEKETKVSGLI